MKNLFCPAEYRVCCLREGFSCQISVTQMIMDSNLSARGLAAFVIFFLSSLLSSVS